MAKQRSGESGGTQQSAGGRPSDGGMSGASSSQQESSVAEKAKNKAAHAAERAQEQATRKLESGIARGKNRTAETVSGVAQSFLASSQQLRDQNQDAAGRYVERAGNQLERLADYLQNTDVEEMIDRVESFARREPALFLGGAFALGLLGARFLKSSRRDQRRSDSMEHERGADWQRTRASYPESATMADLEIQRTPTRDLGATATTMGGSTGATTGTSATRGGLGHDAGAAGGPTGL